MPSFYDRAAVDRALPLGPFIETYEAPVRVIITPCRGTVWQVPHS